MGIGLSAQGVNMNRLPGESLVKRTFFSALIHSAMRVMVAAKRLGRISFAGHLSQAKPLGGGS